MSTQDVHIVPLAPRAVEAISASVILMVLAIGLFVARFYTRRNINAVQSSDWMVLVSLLLSIAFVGIFVAEVTTGMGLHDDDVPLGTSIFQKKLFWISIPFYNAAMITAKASIIIQYFHVFPTRKMRIVCLVMAAIMILCGTWMVFSAIFNCIPVAKFWNADLPGHCLRDKFLWFSNASLNIFTDMAILVIPIPALTSLGLPVRQKVGLCCLFALGSFICRLQSLKALVDSDDHSYHSLAVSMWSAVECNTGIICACLPTLRPAVTRIWPSLSFIFPDVSIDRQPEPSITDQTSLTRRGGGGGHTNMRMNFASREIEASRESASKYSVNGGMPQYQQFMNPRVAPMPGNAFAQNLMRKGSFF
ncbi:hypothetical protein UA08_00311 [Talaromyces atroroseus]|uniref:Rhodopsin domain-containing protein n=1 Tax=Talaromyces atroroseus TaxID=1441469 RepID=A0A225B0G3_TALAT|nr:hypothetical protein UA08_00311 [Talaromyces atroroseus]OKL64194.1 hypothetical protein UA08_00311 [Talaromyces atroroseus]